jgi:hypothetical protein
LLADFLDDKLQMPSALALPIAVVERNEMCGAKVPALFAPASDRACFRSRLD